MPNPITPFLPVFLSWADAKARFPPCNPADTSGGRRGVGEKRTAMRFVHIFEYGHFWSPTLEAFWTCGSKRLRSQCQCDSLMAKIETMYTVYVYVYIYIYTIIYTYILNRWALGGKQLRITTRLVLIWILATCRYVFTASEQPGSSLMPLFPYVVFFQKLISIVYRWFHVRLSGTSILHGLLDLTLLDRCMVSKWKHDPIISISCLSGIAFATVFKPRKICTFSWYQYLTSKGPGKWTTIRIYILGRRLFSHYFTNLLGATLQQVKSLAQSYLNILLLYNNLLSPMAVYGAPTLKPSQVFGTWCEPERINQIWSIFAGSIMIILSEIFFIYFFDRFLIPLQIRTALSFHPASFSAKASFAINGEKAFQAVAS